MPSTMYVKGKNGCFSVKECPRISSWIYRKETLVLLIPLLGMNWNTSGMILSKVSSFALSALEETGIAYKSLLSSH
ncbi:hypothetical protein NC653_037131 [Populus alba x Populus x berolinensis]|uniref:Uncharacterized protein n=1 Tax=Populus alba x Populus x berolinensis TaxID=444605 RepID=A0AAD6LLU3_9ROSI|nr:hypothetical protein NC653_037131 [Populus alba x Populus x berolinensis]